MTTTNETRRHNVYGVDISGAAYNAGNPKKNIATKRVEVQIVRIASDGSRECAPYTLRHDGRTIGFFATLAGAIEMMIPILENPPPKD